MKRAALRLGLLLGALFAALAAVSAVLLWQTRRQIQFEAYHQYSVLADELGLRIDSELQGLIAAEEAHGYTDYGFLVLAGDPALSRATQRSPLARLPPPSAVPGAIGYFQVAADGAFSTPAYPENLADPARWGLDAKELAERAALRAQLLEVLQRNALLDRPGMPVAAQALVAARPALPAVAQKKSVSDEASRDKGLAPPAEAVADAKRDDQQAAPRQEAANAATADDAPASQRAFDQLNAVAPRQQSARPATRLDELRLGKQFQNENAPAQAKDADYAYVQNLKANVAPRTARKEQAAELDAGRAREAKVRIFESELDPFEFSLLGDGHGVLYRKVWRGGQRIIQGLVIDQRDFVEGALAKPFRETALAQMSDFVVAYRHDVVDVVRAAQSRDGVASASALRGELLHQLRLSAPFGDFQLLWNIRQLPLGPGGRVIAWTGGVLFALLALGFVLLYRLGLRQLRLARQQQDFVSAVSHELNTPLTSIRMYAEILGAGWASADKQREYLAFIHAESERLSRLIANVLQLARLERRERAPEGKPQRVEALVDMLRSRLHDQIERAGFAADYAVAEDVGAREVRVDADAFMQIFINLVDNALKFAARAPLRRLELGVRRRAGEAQFFVRDHGPGVPPDQRGKIFRLFYRSGDELTREAPGTGIGLALVRQLAQSMHGRVDVLAREPGAEFVVSLPLLPETAG